MATVVPVLFGIPEHALLSFATVLENTNGGRITEVLPMISDTGIEILRYQCDQDLLDPTADEKAESEAGHTRIGQGDQAGDRKGKQEMAKDLRGQRAGRQVDEQGKQQTARQPAEARQAGGPERKRERPPPHRRS